IVAASVALALCLGGLVTGYVLYDKATTPDRGTPRTAVTQYVEAKFANRDDARARRFECRSPRLEQMDALLSDLKDRERQFEVKISVRAYNMVESGGGDTAQIDASLDVDTTVDGAPQRQVQQWRFDLVQQDGWRVCGAQRTS